MNGWLLVRIAGIVVGIATLLRVATTQGLVTYDPLFLAWMDWLSDIVELGFLTKLIGPFLHWGIEQVRSLGINVPDLQDEWRPAWVLSMLIFAAIARHSRGGLLVVVVPFGALVVAVMCGMYGSFATAVVAFVGTTLIVYFVSAANANSEIFNEAKSEGINIGVHTLVATVLLAIMCVALVVVTQALATSPAIPISAADLAVFVGILAFLFLFSGAVHSRTPGWHAPFASANFNTGIDILFTMSSAFAIAVAVANPPIW